MTSIRFGVGVGILTLVALAACDTTDRILDVENPEEIPEENLNDPLLAEVLTQGVIGEFQEHFDDPFIWRGSMLTDEQITGINWEDDARINQRRVLFDEDPSDLMFSRLSRVRSQADSVSGRLRGGLLEDAEDSEELATTLTYAGYSYILLADAMCEAVVNQGSELLSPADLYGIAVDRFTDALAVADRAGREDLADLNRVGLSRAHLNLGNATEAMDWASQVPDDFRFWSEYSENSTGEENILFTRTTGSNHSLGMSPDFLQGTFGDQDLVATQTDPRIQHTTEWTLGHNRLTLLYKPLQAWSFSGFNGETWADGGEPVGFEKSTNITFASGLEARHNFHEALGPGPETLAFVNERRAAGNQSAVSLAGDELMAELREQRGRDLFLAGHRLGDLRRWLRQGTGDFFPSGEHPNAQWGNYGDATCFPLPKEEFEGNPNISR